MPETPAPALLCPTCGLWLVYSLSVIGGLEPRERWDYFTCNACGPYRYRHRTRKLRHADSVPFLSR
jgi:hypothetical protein